MAKQKESSSDVARAERLSKMCATINSGAFGGENKDAVTWLGSRDAIATERFSSGCIELDEALGGGWPKGRFIEVYGAESSGKSTVVLHAVAEHQKKYPDEDCALIDLEFCLAKGTLVYDAKSAVYRPVEEMFDIGDVTILSWMGRKMVPQKATIKESGERDVYLIRCTGGRNIRLTDNHRVLTQDGYKEVKDLTSEDQMFVPGRISMISESIPTTNDDLYLYRLLGHHIGDGTIEKAEIGTIDSAVVDDLRVIGDRQDCSVTFSGTLARFRRRKI